MSNLNLLKEKIEALDKFHHIKILSILNDEDSSILNENNNGIFVNLTSINDATIKKIEDYLEYVKAQEKQLTEIEVKKNILTNTYFKDNKENPILEVNAET